MDPALPTVPIIIIGIILAIVYDPIFGLVIMLLGLMMFLSLIDPSHGAIAMYLMVPLILFLLVAWVFWDTMPYERRIYFLLAFILLSLALAAAFGHDYSGIIFAPMFIIPIGLAFAYDPSGKLAVFVTIATYTPYSIFIYYVVRSVKDVAKHPMIGKQGIVIETVSRNGGLIKIGNTFRDAITNARYSIPPGTKVIVEDVIPESLTLVVRPLSASRQTSRRPQRGLGGVLSILFFLHSRVAPSTLVSRTPLAIF